MALVLIHFDVQPSLPNVSENRHGHVPSVRIRASEVYPLAPGHHHAVTVVQASVMPPRRRSLKLSLGCYYPLHTGDVCTMG